MSLPIHDQAVSGAAVGNHGARKIIVTASVIATVPMIILFFLGRRHFVQGIATTGSKG